MTYYAEGYFEGDNGNISVSKPSGGYDNLPSGCSVRSEDVSTESAGIFTKYASVTYTLKTNSAIGDVKTFTATIKVNANGNGNA